MKMVNKTLMAQRALRLVNGYWDKYLIEKYGEIKDIYTLPTKDYLELYKKVCKAIHKTDCRLRRIGGFALSHEVLGKVMSFDALIS